MLFTNRGINPNNVTSTGRFSFAEAAGYTPEEQQAIEESYEDRTILEGKPTSDNYSGGVIDEEAMIEAAIVQEVEMMNDNERKKYLNSSEFNSLVEAGVVGRRAIVRLNRAADLDRRIHLLCLQMAKENGDADWEALRQNRIKERKLLGKLYNKYGQRVQRQASLSQKRLIKLSPQAFNLDMPMR